MKIFLSWSGKQSLLLARELKEWLPRVFQSVEPFLSTDDIEAGEKWQDRLNSVLGDHDFGIVCLTRTNLTAPYIMFESGALAKKLGKTKLIPILCDLSEAELSKNPLTQFQYVHLNDEGIWKLAQSINTNLGDKGLKDDILKSTFEVWWPKMGAKIDPILAASDAPKNKIDTDDALEEILHTVRALARREASLGPLSKAVADLATSSHVWRSAQSDWTRDFIVKGVPHHGADRVYNPERYALETNITGPSGLRVTLQGERQELEQLLKRTREVLISNQNESTERIVAQIDKALKGESDPDG